MNWQINRQSDYVFDWDKMLALNGNTAPYLQYAYTRIGSIFRKLGDEGTAAGDWRADAAAGLTLAAPQEIALAKRLLGFGLVLEAVAEEYRPNYLCNYLYELAGDFTSFYENCPVLKASCAERASRLALCDLAGRVLRQGLEILGIETDRVSMETSAPRSCPTPPGPGHLPAQRKRCPRPPRHPRPA